MTPAARNILADTLADLARAKVAFQQRTLVALLRAAPADLCDRCHGVMVSGIVTAQTYTEGDCGEGTLSPDGPGAVVQCWKCRDCGWSVA